MEEEIRKLETAESPTPISVPPAMSPLLHSKGHRYDKKSVHLYTGRGSVSLQNQPTENWFQDWGLVEAYADRVDPVPEEAIPGVCHHSFVGFVTKLNSE